MTIFAGIFNDVNEQVNDIAVQVGQSPQGWNAGIFNMVRTLSETVVLPIAGFVLTFIMCYELINMVIERNNMAEFETFNLFKWIFKTIVAVLILTNTFTIVMGVFEIAQGVVNASAGFVTDAVELGNPTMMATLHEQLEEMTAGGLIGLYFEIQIVKICLWIMVIVIFVVVWGRMIEVYITISLAPIPLATIVNREWGQTGNNYLKALFAISFQGFLIMVCVAIYAVLVAGIVEADNIHSAIWRVAGYTALLCFILLKTGGISKSLFTAH